MITTLIRRELLDNLITFKFATFAVIMLLLVVANTVVLIKDYERRLSDYNSADETNWQALSNSDTYSRGMIGIINQLKINRPPNPMSIFNAGLDKRIGNEVLISHNYIPTIWDSDKHASKNTFFNIFSSMDIVLIFQVILSLLSLIYGYDAIAGEYERGTLQLVLSHSVRRGYILTAKYISAMLCMLIPLLMSLLLMLILLTTSPTISFNTDDFLRIGGILLTSLLYLSLFYLIGMLISAITRRTTTALILSMFVWGLLVLVYPNMILIAIDTAPQEEPQEAAYNQIKQVQKEYEEKWKQYLINHPLPGLNVYKEGVKLSFYTTSMSNSSRLLSYKDVGGRNTTIGEDDEIYIQQAQIFFKFLFPLSVSAAERTWIVRKPAIDRIYIQPANKKRLLLKFSPAGLYDTAIESWVGTDLNGIQDFFTAARRYRQVVVNYLFDEKLFESRQWFLADQGAADWSALPQFSYQRSDIGINATRALMDLFLLLLMNVIFFIFVFLVFIKIEV